MPRYTVQAPDGRKVTLEGPEPPTEADLDEVFAALPPVPAAGKEPEAAVPASAPAAGASAIPEMGAITEGGAVLANFLKGAAKEAPLAASRAVSLPVDAGTKVVENLLEQLGMKDYAQRMREQRALGKLQREEPFVAAPGEGMAEGAGRAVAKAAPGVGLAVATGGASLPVQAAVQGAAGAMQTASEGGSAGEIALSGGISAAAPAVAKGVGKLVGKVSDRLKTSALTIYEQAFHPTKQATKVEAQRVLPEALERDIQGSLRKIGNRTAEEVNRIGGAIHETYKAATAAGKKINANGLADALEGLKTPFVEIVPGTPKQIASKLLDASGKPIMQTVTEPEVVILNQAAVDGISAIQNTLKKFATTATPLQIQKYKEVIDGLVSASNGFTRDLPKVSVKALQKQARNSFRRALNKSALDPAALEALNADYHFWRGLNDVVGQTIGRQTGQQKTMELILSTMRGGGVGATVGGSIGAFAAGPAGAAAGGMIGAGAGTMLSTFLKSPFYRTFSAVQKDALAEILAGSAKALQTEEGKRVVNTLALFGLQVRKVKKEREKAAGERQELEKAAPSAD
jgi:hypothetical protein